MHELVLSERFSPPRHHHDLAKRLLDYGFHAPRCTSRSSYPGPSDRATETESRKSFDRFVEAMHAVLDEDGRDPTW
jgi:glycine cleavage system protein P-like pyridoxal-binding family